ncbi:hypothetical protein QJS10_CPA10g01836 [Acorus calamus]|uniref:RNase H type-1 domain-containing protein n=1 Tax=Acorus calamus TaxID=4465 RepID=A0AAV9E2H4_ACOCL|nr:hypothetical protein QJS10_CPA10g01836 [Acorus calamus]
MGLPRNASRSLLGWVEILDQLHLQPAMLKVVKASRVPSASINHLELLGVKSGALLCLQLNLSKVQFTTDSTTVTCWLQGRDTVPWTSKRDLIETFEALSHLED